MKRCLILAVLAFLSSTCLFAQIPTAGLVGYWPFNGNANDASGNGNNGNVNGATLASDRFGNPNSAYSFNGAGNYISVATNPSLDFSINNKISVSLWIYPIAYAAGNFNKIFISKQSGSGTTQQGFNCWFNNGNAGMLIRNGSTDNFGGPAYGSALPLNNWSHLTMTYDTGTAKFYYNGNLIFTATGQTSTIGNNSLDLLFGKANWNNINAEPFNGVMDEIAIYNRALSSSEVNAIYTGCNGTPNSTISAIGNTTFCQGSNVILNVNESYSTYQWQKNNASINGATSKSYTAKTSGTYRCIVSNACGTDTSNTINLTSLPNVPNTVLITGVTTFCIGDSVTLNSSNTTPGYSYQWYRNNIAINGATSNTCIGKNPGTYKVVTKNNSNGCSRISSNSAVVVVSCRTSNRDAYVGNVEPVKDFLLYPNPNEGSFTIEINNESIEDVEAHYQLMNINGQIVYSGASQVSNGQMKTEINLDRNFTKGLYLVKVQVNGIEMTEKVILQ